MLEFCDYCNDMLYIKKNDEDDNMILYCKKCDNHKNLSKNNTESFKIISNSYDMSEYMYRQYMNNNIIHDHTIPHVNNIECPNESCESKNNKKNDVMYIKYDIVNIKYLYHCVYCKTFWKN